MGCTIETFWTIERVLTVSFIFCVLWFEIVLIVYFIKKIYDKRRNKINA